MIRAVLQLETLEDRSNTAPVLLLPDGTQVIIALPTAVVVLPPLVPMRAIVPGPRPPAPARLPLIGPPPQARPIFRPLPFREIGHSIELYLPEETERKRFPSPFPEQQPPEEYERMMATFLHACPSFGAAELILCERCRNLRPAEQICTYWTEERGWHEVCMPCLQTGLTNPEQTPAPADQ